MDPLVQLERQCVASAGGIDKKTTSSPLAKTQPGEHTSDDDIQKEMTPEVVAVFTYNTRDYCKDDVESRNPQHQQQQPHYYYAETSKSHKKERRRSRSRERDYVSTKRDKDGREVTHVCQEGYVDKSPDDKTTHTLSPIDRMILRQEALLMRQSAKFLKGVKDQQKSV